MSPVRPKPGQTPGHSDVDQAPAQDRTPQPPQSWTNQIPPGRHVDLEGNPQEQLRPVITQGAETMNRIFASADVKARPEGDSGLGQAPL